MGSLMIGYDSDNVEDIPTNAPMVNYYGDGEPGSATLAQLSRFPTPFKFSITRTPNRPGYWGDVEPGCIWPISTAVDVWRSGTVKGLYIDESNWEMLRNAITVAGLRPPPYWVAGYPYVLPNNPQVPQSWIELGCLMWQYANPDTSGGHYDLSVTAPGFPIPIPLPEELMASAIEVVTGSNGTVESLFAQSADNHLIQWIPPGVGINTTTEWQAYDINSLLPGAPSLAP